MDTPTLRVLIVAPSQGEYGGIEAVMLAQAQSAAQARGISPRLCFKLVRGAAFSEKLRAECDTIGVPYVVVPRASRALWDNLRWANVVHGHNAPPDIVGISRLLRRPVVLTIHNHRRTDGSLHARLWAVSVRLANVRCYVSDFVRQTWEPGGLRPGSQIMPAISRLPDHPVTWERKGFFFIGRWIANKGIEELLEAYANAKIDHLNWPLTLAGSGPLRQQVEEFIDKRELKTVHVRGFVEENEKFLLMGTAKWNVAPPHTREDLGLTPIEARYLAVPSIITRDGGLPESAGPAALIAEPGNVPSLRACLEQAAAMPEGEYRQRALTSKSQLHEFLRPLSDYQAIYRQLAGISPS